jgi:hypothetical protein
VQLGDATGMQPSVQRKREATQIAKNRFYRAIFTSGSSSEVDLLKNDQSPPVLDLAAQALEQLNRKPPGVV